MVQLKKEERISEVGLYSPKSAEVKKDELQNKQKDMQ